MKQTTKTLTTVGALAAVALGVAFAAAWAGRDEERKADQKEKSAKLFELEKGNARELKLTRAGKLVVDLKRDGEKSPWKIVAPVQADADETAMNTLLDKLLGLKSKSEVDQMDPKLAGLADEANARLSLSVTDGAGKTEALLFGEENPFDQTVYVKRPGEAKLRLIAKADQGPLDKKLFDLRDKRVTHIDETAGVSKLVVTPAGAVAKAPVPGAGGTFAYEIDRDGSGWKLAAPVAEAADSGAIDRLVAAIKNLRATQVISETSDAATLAQYGLAFPKESVEISVVAAGKDSYVRKLLIGQPTPAAGTVTLKTYAKRDDLPTIFEVDGQIVKDLSRELFELQDKTVLKVDREAVRRIEYATPGQDTLVVARTKAVLEDGGTGEEKFAVTAPKAGPAKKFKISGNLYALANLKAAAFDGPANAKALAKDGLDHPRTVTLFGDKDAVLGRVLIGAETGEKDKRRYVRIEGSPRIVEVEKSVIDDFPQTAAEALEAPPAPPPALNAKAGPMSLPGGSPPFVPK